MKPSSLLFAPYAAGAFARAETPSNECDQGGLLIVREFVLLRKP